MAAKIFEVNDVLPATTQLRISWTVDETTLDLYYSSYGEWYVRTTVSPQYFLIDAPAEGTSTYVTIAGVIICEFDNDNNTFKGWKTPYTAPSGNHAYIDIDTSLWSLEKRTVTKAYDYHGEPSWFLWEDLNAPTGFNITFEENGGTTQTDLTEQTALPNPLPTPTKDNHTFLGWYYDSDFTNRAFAGDPLTGNVTLYAKWELNTYTITYNSNGGSIIPQTSDATQLPNPLPIPTKSGYTFAGWYYDDDFTTQAYAEDELEDDVTLYAKWILNTYTITYNSNGGSSIPQTSGATQLPNPLPTPTKSGYTFVAWYYESDFQTRAKAGDTIEANTTLYAKWHNLGSLFTEIADAIRSKDGTSENIRDVDFGERIRVLEVGGAEIPSTAGGSIFTGATIPLTYKNNTHDYENNYEYKSATHNITITGLDGRATITGNGTKNVLVAFDVTSSTTSLKNFLITCTMGEQVLEYKGLHAHYGETITGILTFAYNNITHDGSEGTFNTSGLTANYKFIVTSSSDLPIFSGTAALWNTIYSHQLLNVLIGNFSGTSIGDNFMFFCYSFNQPLTLPSGLNSIGDEFMYNCYAFNQPLTLPSDLSSLGSDFLSYCYAFNQVLTLPSSLSSIGGNFMYYCYAFNQVLTLPSSLSSIGGNFMSGCRAFNQVLTLPSGLNSLGSGFMSGCYTFNQVLTLPSGLNSLGSGFMNSCYTFNQPLTLPSGLSSIGTSFMSYCYAFNQVLTLPSGLNSIGDNFMYNCYAFNQPLTLPSGLNSIGRSFMYNCHAFNQVLTLPSNLSSMDDEFMYNCYALSTIIWNASVYPTGNNSLSQNLNTKTNSTYGAGIKVYGTKRAELISAKPNRTSSPYRKLINGGS